jgi:alpha-glucosidase (family GH31 glycosyl hydrolase)
MGHSGDVIASWASLQYQPLFTATAANVNFGYWSHDLGGHRPNPTDERISKDPDL